MNTNAAVLNQFPTRISSNSPSKQLTTYFDSKYKISWCLMNSAPRPCFTKQLLSEFHQYIVTTKQEMNDSNGQKYDFIVLGSDIDGVFSLGGDLSLFKRCIERKDREALFDYAIKCIDVLHENINHLGCGLTTISLVKGDALGGGFEAALASNVLIAEKGVKMGLPEVLFNLFPGMGAYSLLSRKIGCTKAEKIILSGKLFTSDELFEIGVIDILAEKGEGELAVYKYTKAASRYSNSYNSIRQVRDICNKIDYTELVDVAKVWVDAAFKLTTNDLKMMNRLISRQNTR